MDKAQSFDKLDTATIEALLNNRLKKLHTMANIKITYKDLESIDKEDLLNLKINELPLTIENHWISSNHRKLLKELKNKKLKVNPHIWISDDWFCPDGVPGFAIPFFILHPRLVNLEVEMIGDAEGHDRQWAMMLMRHECGHVLDNAFHLRKSKRRQQLFGLTSEQYPETYRPNPRSKKFVKHLDGNYAQSHPDEDWAETFATWLTPGSKWRKSYQDWPAIEKLELLNELMVSVTQIRPFVQNKRKVDHFKKMNLTLREYYKNKRRRLGLNVRDHFKVELNKIFSKNGDLQAWKLLHQHKNSIINKVTKETTLSPYLVKRLILEAQRTCKNEKLYIAKSKLVTKDQFIKLLMTKSNQLIKQIPQRINM